MKVDVEVCARFSVFFRKVVSGIKLRGSLCPPTVTTRLFNMDRPNGFWQGVVKPELGRKVEQQLLSQALMKQKPIRPIPEPAGGNDDMPPHMFFTGKRLRQIEHEFPTTHSPKMETV